MLLLQVKKTHLHQTHDKVNRTYFEKQEHATLGKLLLHLSKQERKCANGIRLMVSTYSGATQDWMLIQNKEERIIETETDGAFSPQAIALDTNIVSANQLEQQVAEFFLNDDVNVLIIQSNVLSKAALQRYNQARFIIRAAESEFYAAGGSGVDKHIVFVAHLHKHDGPAGAVLPLQIVFNPEWDYVSAHPPPNDALCIPHS